MGNKFDIKYPFEAKKNLTTSFFLFCHFSLIKISFKWFKKNWNDVASSYILRLRRGFPRTTKYYCRNNRNWKTLHSIVPVASSCEQPNACEDNSKSLFQWIRITFKKIGKASQLFKESPNRYVHITILSQIFNVLPRYL